MEASNLVVPRSPTVGLLVGWVGHDRSSVAYSSGALSTSTRLTNLPTSLLLLEAPALFLPQVSEKPVCRKVVSENAGSETVW